MTFQHIFQNAVWGVTAMSTALMAACVQTPPRLSSVEDVRRPNIIIVLADDMGLGDIGAYNSDSKVPTPHLNRLASQGMRFNDAHSPSAVCTPTRYALLTGRYAWRTDLKFGVLNGMSPLLIEQGRQTMATMLRDVGYKTAIIGKWHLGLSNSEPDYRGAAIGNLDGNIDGLRPGPNEVGFDYFFGIPASLDHTPYVFVENGQVLTPLTGRTIDASDMRRRGGDGFFRAGEIGDGFAHQDVLGEITRRSVDYISAHAGDDNDAPFFLYIPFSAPHTPWLPSEAFMGTSGAGHYGDFAAEVDGAFGQVLSAVDRSGLAENTLIIFTSDNGAHWLESDIERYGHLANHNLRGQKADIHEGGHRVPFLVAWPGTIPAGSVSDHPIVLTDLMVTLAGLVGAQIADNDAPDSFDILPTLLGNPDAQDERAPMIHHSSRGMFAIRDGDWKMVEGLGSGGFTRSQMRAAEGGEDSIQLYNLVVDPNENEDVSALYPDIVARLQAELDIIRGDDAEPLQ